MNVGGGDTNYRPMPAGSNDPEMKGVPQQSGEKWEVIANINNKPMKIWVLEKGLDQKGATAALERLMDIINELEMKTEFKIVDTYKSIEFNRNKEMITEKNDGTKTTHKFSELKPPVKDILAAKVHWNASLSLWGVGSPEAPRAGLSYGNLKPESPESVYGKLNVMPPPKTEEGGDGLPPDDDGLPPYGGIAGRG